MRLRIDVSKCMWPFERLWLLVEFLWVWIVPLSVIVLMCASLTMVDVHTRYVLAGASPDAASRAAAHVAYRALYANALMVGAVCVLYTVVDVMRGAWRVSAVGRKYQAIWCARRINAARAAVRDSIDRAVEASI